MGTAMVITGECFCGEVTFEGSGDVFDGRSCHCSRCRKAFSGAGSAYALVHPGTFKWTKGEALLTSYVNQETAGLKFCKVCGSTLCGVFNGEVHGVSLGCLNDDPEVTLARHIFVGSKASWDMIGGDTPQFEEYPTPDEFEDE
jgi:hypothetical protein